MSAQCNRVKHVSNHKRWEYWRSKGIFVSVGGQVVQLKGAALDDYTDEAIWRAAHPGQEPVERVEVSSGLPAE